MRKEACRLKALRGTLKEQYRAHRAQGSQDWERVVHHEEAMKGFAGILHVLPFVFYSAWPAACCHTAVSQ
jgi:hypothetical protein